LAEIARHPDRSARADNAIAVEPMLCNTVAAAGNRAGPINVNVPAKASGMAPLMRLRGRNLDGVEQKAALETGAHAVASLSSFRREWPPDQNGGRALDTGY